LPKLSKSKGKLEAYATEIVANEVGGKAIMGFHWDRFAVRVCSCCNRYCLKTLALLAFQRSTVASKRPCDHH
jgi:hypothetical protein